MKPCRDILFGTGFGGPKLCLASTFQASADRPASIADPLWRRSFQGVTNHLSPPIFRTNVFNGLRWGGGKSICHLPVFTAGRPGADCAEPAALRFSEGPVGRLRHRAEAERDLPGHIRGDARQERHAAATRTSLARDADGVSVRVL